MAVLRGGHAEAVQPSKDNTRATLDDIARCAGLSSSTVDRVLNARVRAETAQRVLHAATTLNYRGSRPIEHDAVASRPRMAVVLQQADQAFYKTLATSFLDRASPDFDISLSFLPSQAPQEMARHLLELSRRFTAIAMVSVDHPMLDEAVRLLRGHGIAVYALLSDFATENRTAYLGIDNHLAGRTAASLLSRHAPAPGRVAVIVGNYRYLGQKARERGFVDYLTEQAEGFSVGTNLFSLEDCRLAHQLTLSLLEQCPDLVGIYAAGGGMEGVIDAVRSTRDSHRIALVCHELTAHSRARLVEGTVSAVINTPVGPLVEAAVQMALGRQGDVARTAPDTVCAFEVLDAGAHFNQSSAT